MIFRLTHYMMQIISGDKANKKTVPPEAERPEPIEISSYCFTIFCCAVCPSQLALTKYNPRIRLPTFKVSVCPLFVLSVLFETCPLTLNISKVTFLFCQSFGTVILSSLLTGLG